MTAPHLVLVTDPMCSWCWGMADELHDAMAALGDEASFDLMLGGINTHSTQPIGAYGRRYLMRLWREVAETTGQRFGFALPDQYVHNSVRACLAVEAVRVLTDAPPFEFLRRVQEQFFVYGRDVTRESLLLWVAADMGLDTADVQLEMNKPALLERVRFQFDNASTFGTNAMPSLLLEADGRLQLFAGGYVDAAMLTTLLEARKS